MKIGFIGLGKYGSAIAQAILKRGNIEAADLIVHDLDRQKAEPFKKLGCGVANDWDTIIKKADVVIYGLPSTSYLAYERARYLALRLDEIAKPRLLVRMDTMVHPASHGETKSKVSLIRIIFGLSIESSNAPIAILKLEEELAPASKKLANSFIRILRKVGFVHLAKDCHGLLLFRFLAGTMMLPIAQALQNGNGGEFDKEAKGIFDQLLGNSEISSGVYELVKQSTRSLLVSLKQDMTLLKRQIESPGGLTEFLWPFLSPWPTSSSTLTDFVNRMKAKIYDYESRLIGVSLVASSRMAEQDLHSFPLPHADIDTTVQAASRRICNHLGIYCRLWPRVFSYVSLANGIARQVNVVRGDSDNDWFKEVINQWFLKNYSKSGILVSPQTFLQELQGYAQIALIHGMAPANSSVYIAPEGMKNRDLGVLLDVDVACIAEETSVKVMINRVRNGTVNVEEFVSWMEKFVPSDSLRKAFSENFHHFVSGSGLLDGVIRYCIWVMGASTKPYGTWGNIFIPFSHRNTLPVSLHVGIHRWIGAEHLSCLQSILSAYFMPPLEQDSREKASRAAAAAILSRNMSHHIGSHVMPRATVREVKARLGTLYETGTMTSKDLDGLPRVSRSVDRLKTALDDFIQKKADFLAEVTTDPASSSDSKRLGRDILAPLMRNALLMDNIARNEGFGYPLRLMPDFLNMKIVKRNEYLKQGWESQLNEKDKKKLNSKESQGHLAELQMRMRSTLRLSLCVSEDEECRRILGTDLPPYDPLYSLSEDDEQPELFGVDANCAHLDPMIAVPGMVGQYALYGILENIIRNAAKHGSDKNNSTGLHIHLHIEEDGEDYYRLSIWDDRTDPANVIINSTIPGDKKEKRGRRLAEHLQCWAEADLIDLSGAIRREAWGVAEIVICANLLAGRRQFDYHPGIIEILEGPSPHEGVDALSCTGQSVSPGCQKNRLIHRIHLLKAKRAAFVGKRFSKAWKSHLEAFKKEGVYVFDTVAALKTFFGKNEARQAFHFAVFDGGGLEASDFGDSGGKADDAFLSVLPFRVFWLTADDRVAGPPDGLRAVPLKYDPFANLSCEPSADALMEKLWQLWIGKNEFLNPNPTKNAPIMVTDVVYLDVEADKPPYTAWAPEVIKFNQKDSPVKMYLKSKNGEEIGKEHLDNNIRAGFVRHKDPTPGNPKAHDMFEVFGKRSADCDMLLGATLPTDEHPFWELPYAMAEAGLVRILVLDERMAERAMTPLPKEADGIGNDLKGRLLEGNGLTPCFWHMAQRAKVFIATHLQVGNGPTEEMKPLHEQSFSEAESRQNGVSDETRPACPVLKILITENGLQVVENGYNRYSGLDNNRADKAPVFDIVVIHQGVIDTRRPKRANGEYEIGEETMREWITKSHKWLVVESGRGIPPGLQKKPIRFLSFSALDQAMMPDGIGKLFLTRRLMALPRFVDNGGES